MLQQLHFELKQYQVLHNVSCFLFLSPVCDHTLIYVSLTAHFVIAG
jgi:hypothetical protein